MSGEGIFPSAEHECSMSYYEIPWTLVLTLLDFRSNKQLSHFSGVHGVIRGQTVVPSQSQSTQCVCFLLSSLK